MYIYEGALLVYLQYYLPCLRVLLGKQVVEQLNVLELAVQCGAEDGRDTDGVLVHHVHGLLRVHDVVAVAQLHFLQLHLEVARELLPANLHFLPNTLIGW